MSVAEQHVRQIWTVTMDRVDVVDDAGRIPFDPLNQDVVNFITRMSAWRRDRMSGIWPRAPVSIYKDAPNA